MTKDEVLAELRRDGRAVAIRRVREGLGLSRGQVADSLGIGDNDVYVAETKGTGTRACPEAFTKVREYLWQVAGYTPPVRLQGEVTVDGNYTKDDIVSVPHLEGQFKYIRHFANSKGKVFVEVYGGKGYGSTTKCHAKLRVITPEQLGHVIERARPKETNDDE